MILSHTSVTIAPATLHNRSPTRRASSSRLLTIFLAHALGSSSKASCDFLINCQEEDKQQCCAQRKSTRLSNAVGRTIRFPDSFGYHSPAF